MDDTMRTGYPDDDVLADPALCDLFAQLRAAGERPAPRINPELANLIAAGPSIADAQCRKATRAAVIGMVTTAVLTGGVGAAAANELPRPVQRVVSTVVNDLTPFEIPNPDEHGSVQHQQDTTIQNNGNQPGQNVDSPGTQGSEPSTENQTEHSTPGGSAKENTTKQTGASIGTEQHGHNRRPDNPDRTVAQRAPRR